MNVDRGVLETIAEIGVLPVVTVDREDDIDPLADAPGRIRVEWDIERGLDFLAHLRSSER